MLCTKCSEEIRPVVAVDIDGTLGEYHRHFVDFARGYLGATESGPPSYLASDPPVEHDFRNWFLAQYDIDERTWYDIKLAYRQGAQKRTMPVYRGADDLTQSLRAAGVEVWITTSRPYNRLDNIDPDTREWTERHLIGYDYMIYDDDKYNILADRVGPNRVVAVLDDLAEQYDAAAKLFGVTVPILRCNEYNKAVRRPRMATNLLHAQAMINERLEAWRS